MKSRQLTGTVLAALLVASGVLLAGCASPSGKPTKTATPTPTKTATSTPTHPVTPPPEGACSIDQLQVSLGEAQGAAGSSIVPIVFKNIGSADCTLEGFPKVVFVGDGNGTQLGAPAQQDTDVDVVENNLQPGASASAQLKIAVAENYGDKCTIVPADGLRVFPPHSSEAVFLKDDTLKACSNDSVVLMTVQPVKPAS